MKELSKNGIWSSDSYTNFICILVSPNVPGSMAQEVVEELSESLGDICEELYGTRPKAGELLAASLQPFRNFMEFRNLLNVLLNVLCTACQSTFWPAKCTASCADEHANENWSSGAVARRTRDAAVLRSRAFAIHVAGGKMGTSQDPPG